MAYIGVSVILKGLRLTASRIQLTNFGSWTQSNSALKRSMTDRSKEVSNLKSKLSNDVVCVEILMKNWFHSVAQNGRGCQVAQVTFLMSQKNTSRKACFSTLLPPTKATATYCQSHLVHLHPSASISALFIQHPNFWYQLR